MSYRLNQLKEDLDENIHFEMTNQNQSLVWLTHNYQYNALTYNHITIITLEIMLPIKQMQMVGRQKLHIIFPDRNGWVVRAAMLVIKPLVD